MTDGTPYTRQSLSGVPNGMAELDNTGNVPLSELGNATGPVKGSLLYQDFGDFGAISGPSYYTISATDFNNPSTGGGAGPTAFPFQGSVIAPTSGLIRVVTTFSWEVLSADPATLYMVYTDLGNNTLVTNGSGLSSSGIDGFTTALPLSWNTGGSAGVTLFDAIVECNVPAGTTQGVQLLVQGDPINKWRIPLGFGSGWGNNDALWPIFSIYKA